MEGVKPREQSIMDNLGRELVEVTKFDGLKMLYDRNEKDNIFTKGLSSHSGASPALKYLACFGLTRELRPAFGDEFEEMTSLHYMRYQQVQGYRTRHVVLQHAWPPKNNKNPVDKGVLDNLAKMLEEQMNTELVDEPAIEAIKDVLQGKPDPDLATENPPKRRRFNNEIGKEHLYCVVFDQGTPSAQGGDVLALLVNTATKTATLVRIRCKHYKKEKNDKIREWWNSLGVALAKDGTAEFEPKGGSAGYSFKGLQKFAELLSNRLSKGAEKKNRIEVQVGTRILAVSFGTPKKKCDMPMPKNNLEKFRVWFREMMEPTISAVQPNVPKGVPTELEPKAVTDTE